MLWSSGRRRRIMRRSAPPHFNAMTNTTIHISGVISKAKAPPGSLRETIGEEIELSHPSGKERRDGQCTPGQWGVAQTSTEGFVDVFRPHTCWCGHGRTLREEPDRGATALTTPSSLQFSSWHTICLRDMDFLRLPAEHTHTSMHSEVEEWKTTDSSHNNVHPD